MKILKKLLISILLITVVSIIMPKIIAGMQAGYRVEAASIKLNKSKKTIYEGATYKLKVSGTKKKVNWKSSNKSVAKVDSKGNVTAKKNGTATITAKVGKKKLKCKVNVKLLQFDTKFYPIKDVSEVYNKSWKVKTSKTYYYDLDADGKKEAITIKAANGTSSGDYYEKYVYELNGKKFSESVVRPELYIVDLDKKDKTKQIVIFHNVPNDAWYEVCTKKGDKLKSASISGYKLKVDNKSKLVVEDAGFLNRIQPQIYDSYYVYKKGKLSYKKADMKKLKKANLKSKGGITFTKKTSNFGKYDSLIYSDLSEKEVLKESNSSKEKGPFKIIKFINHKDTQNAAYVKLKNGTKGYIFEPIWQ